MGCEFLYSISHSEAFRRREEGGSRKEKKIYELTLFSSLGLSPFLTGKLIERLRDEDKKERMS